MPDDPKNVGELLARTAPGAAPQVIGSNSAAAPLAEILPAETAELKARSDELLAKANAAKVTNDAESEDAVALSALIRAHLKAIEEAHEERKRPFLENGRTVDAHFNALAFDLGGAEYKKKPTGAFAAVRGLVDGWLRKKERELEQERQRRQAEARRAEADAEAAAAKAAISGSVADAVVAEKAAVRADTVAAAAPVPKAVISSSVGAKAFGRKVPVVTFLDTKDEPLAQSLAKACSFLIETQPGAVQDFVQGRYGALARSGARKLPGAVVTEETSTSIRA